MLAYRTEGDGPPLLLIHGWGVTYAVWQNLAPLLRPHARLIMVELPGLGASPPSDVCQPYAAACSVELAQLRTHLGIERWDVLGYSYGARVAEAYIRFDAAHIRRAVFVCPTHLNGWLARIQHQLVQLDRRFPALTNWVISGWRLNRLIVLLGFNGQRHRYAREWVDEIGGQPMDALKAAFHDLKGEPAPAPLTNGIPALYIWGQYDRIARPPRHPGCNDWQIPAGHSAPMLAAEPIAREMLPFLGAAASALTLRDYPLERPPRRRNIVPRVSLAPLRAVRLGRLRGLPGRVGARRRPVWRR